MPELPSETHGADHSGNRFRFNAVFLLREKVEGSRPAWPSVEHLEATASDVIARLHIHACDEPRLIWQSLITDTHAIAVIPYYRDATTKLGKALMTTSYEDPLHNSACKSVAPMREGCIFPVGVIVPKYHDERP